ncbi:hypothetical protein Glove_505g21 [Diversispora epigaea]|uniref:Erythromycin esterase n=1 Tax=Diversispora epigaea TaxID=1348612 RepID=A0A397GM71_9GLOM|nr:hypothetical protein Glove_505g21 [Diversispora epigaea]
MRLPNSLSLYKKASQFKSNMTTIKGKPVNKEIIIKNIHPFSLNNSKDYDALMKDIGSAKVVLIGEASHGTEDFYRERCLITQRLIKEKGFTVVACEADWPDAFKVNRYVQNFKRNDAKEARASLSGFRRFPTWMWRNLQVMRFVEWMRAYNDHLEAQTKLDKGNNNWNRYDKVGFYGLDLYSLFGSMEAVIEYLQKTDPEAAEKAKKLYSCFDDFYQSTDSYAFAGHLHTRPLCEQEVIKVMTSLVRKYSENILENGHLHEDEDAIDELFAAEINAIVVRDAEVYYRTMFGGHAESWNKRDTHMINILKVLIVHLERMSKKEVKAVVWAHNSHIGDARHTDQGQRRKKINIGQLARETFGTDHTYSIGFTTHTGSVTCASDWSGDRETKRVIQSRPSSVENFFHIIAEETKVPNFILRFNRINSNVKVFIDEELIKALAKKQQLRQRAIGVIYHPETEMKSHYFTAETSLQFDAVIHIDETSALKAMDKHDFEVRDEILEKKEYPETYPTGE